MVELDPAHRAASLLHSLQQGDTSQLGVKAVKESSLNAQHVRIERFAIAGHIMGELVDELIVRDTGGVEAFRFAPELDSEVKDTATLSLWVGEIFKDAAEERYARDGEFKRAVDRLFQLTLQPFGKNADDMMPGMQAVIDMPRARAIAHNIGPASFVVDADNMVRRGLWVADYYDMALPESDQLAAFAKRSIADTIPLSKLAQPVQDFFDTLEDLSLSSIPQPSTLPKDERAAEFKASLDLVKNAWLAANYRKMQLKHDGVIVKGSNPKSFYKIHQDARSGLRVSPMADNIARLLDVDLLNDAIGCAAGIAKSEKLGASALQLGLRASIRGMHEIGAFDVDPHTLAQIAPYRIGGAVEFRGTQTNMSGGYLQTMMKIAEALDF